VSFAFDTLSYARRLRDSGIPTDQAEAHADAAREFIMTGLVTKADLHREIEVLRKDTAAEFALVRIEATAFQKATAVEFTAVRAEIMSFRDKTDVEFAAVRADMVAMKKDLQESIANVRRELTAVIANTELREP